MNNFNIFAQLDSELHDFFNNTVHIAGTANNSGAKYLTKNTSGYEFSQWQTLNLIELYYNSKFESGLLDSEGQRKTFFNIVKFRSDVASKQIDIDVKDFVFVPDEGASVWPAYFLGHRFRKWAKEKGFGETINQLVDVFPKYGTVVAKRVGNTLERVPLLNIRNQQDAKSLQTASYVIEEHRDMFYHEMEAIKGWDVSQLSMKFGEKRTVYERHGRVPLDWFNKQKGIDGEVENEAQSVDCIAILVKEESDDKNQGGVILFLEQEDKRPYEEERWTTQDGRWLGIGEIENQFENQIFQNMVANMRRRNLLWASKKVFQSIDEEVAKNLVRDVKDGDVLKINANGQITQVTTGTQALADFQQASQDWDKNSDQKSFTFESATGEALPSDTPFRLGVMMSNAVNSHFSLKREKLGLFFTRLVQEQLIPVFNKDNREAHTMMFRDEEGVQELKQRLVKMYTNSFAKKVMLSGRFPDFADIQARVEKQIAERKFTQIDIPERFYEDCAASSTLVITGENMNLDKRIETLTTLYTQMVQAQDPRAERLLGQILALTGQNYDILVGPQAAPAQQPQVGAAQPSQQSAGQQIQDAMAQV